MDIFDVLTMIGGLCLFLFGMDFMGQALERKAGNKLQSLLERLTSGRIAGLLTGMGVTAVIQSSSATTVMVVGFVNSGLMTLRQAINVIMGANIGTTITAWILSLGGIEGDNVFVQMLKPSSFTPILALIGIVCYMFGKSTKHKDTGMILLGFATLMFGMETMSGAVKGLADVPEFAQLFIMFENPVLGLLAGAVLTAIIQSSSASVGILQALAATGSVSYGAAVPIIMGQNIGTCITAILSSFGTNKNAKRTAVLHLLFNIIGSTILLTAFWVVKAVLAPAILDEYVNSAGIAVVHSVFNITCTAILLPASSLLEKLVIKLVPDAPEKEKRVVLDERLLATPAVAIERCRAVATDMASCAINCLKGGIQSLTDYSDELAQKVRDMEEENDYYEDVIGTYLVKLSTHQVSDRDSAEAAKLLKIIGDFERISDHGVSMLRSAEELIEKKKAFSADAKNELLQLCQAVNEILDLTLDAFLNDNLESANSVEPLEQVIDKIKEHLRTRHILRLQQGGCSIEVGFVWNDLLTSLERTSDHCSNIAGCIIDAARNNMNVHESLRTAKSSSPFFKEKYEFYASKYLIV
ncbi:MAG: Na/Pi cotransporter family protein [Clostridia bacterium]|nr:Na/Pi cotransporter family protein [Clostridia bacterium]